MPLSLGGARSRFVGEDDRVPRSGEEFPPLKTTSLPPTNDIGTHESRVRRFISPFPRDFVSHTYKYILFFDLTYVCGREKITAYVSLGKGRVCDLRAPDNCGEYIHTRASRQLTRTSSCFVCFFFFFFFPCERVTKMVRESRDCLVDCVD